ncbi:VOC family protein [Novosphingobium resinovorum]|uniref:VOC family protein n=1 Tax=Novosphingobium resinovorum TaxID=158500 RepID=UPI002ED65BEC|nr:VOC family protein [Novosphingobium resinovorum]
MIDPAAIFHTGIAVADMAAAQDFYARSFGVEWAPVHCYRPLPLWIAGEGWREVAIDTVYSRRGPHRLELIQGPKGSFYDPAAMRTATHTGIWVDDVGNEVERLATLGWRVLAAKGSPQERFGNMVYVTDGGPVFELVGRELEPMLTAWFSEA